MAPESRVDVGAPGRGGGCSGMAPESRADCGASRGAPGRGGGCTGTAPESRVARGAGAAGMAPVVRCGAGLWTGIGCESRAVAARGGGEPGADDAGDPAADDAGAGPGPVPAGAAPGSGTAGACWLTRCVSRVGGGGGVDLDALGFSGGFDPGSRDTSPP